MASMTIIRTGVDTTDSDDELAEPPRVPNMNISRSFTNSSLKHIISPPINNHNHIHNHHRQQPNVSRNNNHNHNLDALRMLPLNLILETSTNNKLKLQLTELNDYIPPTVPINHTIKRSISNHNINNKPDTFYQIGELVIIEKNKQGLIRYIGELHHDGNIWYGIEVVGGNRGYHDGSFQGQKYFRCAPNTGVFCKKSQIIRKMNSNDYTNMEEQKHSKRTKRSKVPKKLGPRDIGRIKGWKPSREIYESEDEKKAAEVRRRYKNKVRRGYKRSSLGEIEEELKYMQRVRRKQGPRDIGRIDPNKTDWKPIQNADQIIENESKKPLSFLATNTRKRAHSTALIGRDNHHQSSHRPKTSRNTAKSPKRGKKNAASPRDRKSKAAKYKNLTIVPPKDDDINDRSKTWARAKTPNVTSSGLAYQDKDGLNLIDGHRDDHYRHNKKHAKRRKKKRKSTHNISSSQAEDDRLALVTPIDTIRRRNRSKSGATTLKSARTRNQKRKTMTTDAPGNNKRNSNKKKKSINNLNRSSSQLEGGGNIGVDMNVSFSARSRSSTVPEPSESSILLKHPPQSAKASQQHKQSGNVRYATPERERSYKLITRSKSLEYTDDEQLILHSLNSNQSDGQLMDPQRLSDGQIVQNGGLKKEGSIGSVGGFPDILKFMPQNSQKSEMEESVMVNRRHQTRSIVITLPHSATKHDLTDNDEKNEDKASKKNKGKQKTEQKQHLKRKKQRSTHRKESSHSLNMSQTMFDDNVFASDSDHDEHKKAATDKPQKNGKREIHDEDARDVMMDGFLESENEDDELLFAEINQEIQARKTGLAEIERQLNELANVDFELEFQKNLEASKNDQNSFRNKHLKSIEELENRIRKLDTLSPKENVEKALWTGNGYVDDGDDDVLKIRNDFTQ